jgi:two-component system sensor histidine kinase CpxA
VAEADSFTEGGLIFDLKPWLVFGAGAVIFSVLFWLPLVGGMTRTIGQMRDAARQIAEGRFDVRVSTRRRDELGALGEAINELAMRLNGFVTGQKRFLGDVAHELCSPLARLQMTLGILEQRTEGAQQTYARSAGEKAAQIAALVNDLLAFSKASFQAPEVQLQPVRVLDAAQEAVRRESLQDADIRLEISKEISVSADSEMLIRALANLLRNAIRHAQKNGAVSISAAREGDAVEIRVTDSGPGVPELELSKIFDAFYRTDASRTRDTGGVGLGLTIVKTCVESCRGTVTARNREPSGLEVLIRMPAMDSPGGAFGGG